MEKECSVCGEVKPIELFGFIKARNRYMHYCKACNNKKLEEWRKKNHKRWEAYRQEYQQSEKYKETAKKCRQSDEGKRKHRENERRYREQRKQEVIGYYSKGKMCCSRCGFDDVRALSIDHVEGGGRQHRKSLGLVAGHQFYAWLCKAKFPDGFQVLCMNCQFLKRNENKEH